jgi:ribose transport system substrate-binding protein
MNYQGHVEIVLSTWQILKSQASSGKNLSMLANWKRGLRRAVIGCLACEWVAVSGCGNNRPATIAVIPRTTGVLKWESEHAGAEAAARPLGIHIYWNGPTREDDAERQIAMVEDVIRRKDQGLILAPDAALALMSPVQRVLAHGIPTVVVGSSLTIPPGGLLCYVLNDDAAAGRMAADRIGFLLHGKGLVVVLGLDPNIRGVLVRARSFQAELTKSYPEIKIVEERSGSFSRSQAREITEEILSAHPGVDAIFALTSVATQGACLVLKYRGLKRKIPIVGSGQELDMLASVKSGVVDSVLIENTWQMGHRAVEVLHDLSAGRPVPPVTMLMPLLVTADKVDGLYSTRWLDSAWGPPA